MWIALTGGGVSAIASMAVFAGIPGGVLFVYLAPLPLLLVGLGMGSASALVSALAAVMFTGLFGGVVAAGMYAVINAAPAWFVTRQLLAKKISGDGSENWVSMGPAIALLSLMGSAILVAVALTMGGDGALDAKAAVEAYLSDVFAVMAPMLPGDARLSLVQLLAPLFPGTAGASWVLMLVVNAALAQKILRNGKRNIRPSPTLATLELPNWISWALVSMATIALLGTGEMEYISRNLTIVFATPFFFLGLAVVHYAAKHVTFPGTLLAFFYFVLFVSGWAPLVVVGIGLFEQWAGLRIRFSGPPQNTGDE